jgi:hypothetical protein
LCDYKSKKFSKQYVPVNPNIIRHLLPLRDGDLFVHLREITVLNELIGQFHLSVTPVLQSALKEQQP